MRHALLGILILPALVGGAGALRAGDRAEDPSAPAALERALTGRFDAEARAARDGVVPARTLRACRVAAPALGDRVLYVEEAFRDAPARPFVRRLYVIAGAHGTDRVTLREFAFGLEAPARDLCAEGARVPADVEERTGCAVELSRRGDRFEGATAGTACSSILNGASYSTRTLAVAPGALAIRDQGFDAARQAVWGAERAATVFTRRAP